MCEKQTFLEELGLTKEEADAIYEDMNSEPDEETE